MGQGSQIQKSQTIDDIDKNPFSVVKPQHKTAAKVQLKRPNILNPVQDPRHRDHSIGGSSDGDNRSLQNSSVGGQGYASGHRNSELVTDNESARLSNVQPYKFNARKNRENPNQMNIRKINPNAVQKPPKSRGNSSGIGAGLQMRPDQYHTLDVNQQRSVISPDQYMSGGGSVMSGVSGGIPRHLPELKKVSTGSITRA